LPRSFTRNYTVDTYFGRWCPKDVWDSVDSGEEKFKSFLQEFRELTTDDKLDVVIKEAEKIQAELLKRGLILDPGAGHLESWRERIINLQNNENKLKRFYYKYEINDLPFNVEQTREIDDLYDNIRESIELAQHKNIVSRKILDSIDNKDISLLALNEEERNALLDSLNQ